VTPTGRFLRRFSALLLIVWVGVLVGLFVRGQFQRGAGVAPGGEQAGDEDEGGEPPHQPGPRPRRVFVHRLHVQLSSALGP